MEYTAPEIKILYKYASELCLETWSADKDTGGTNIPEAKESIFDEESDCAYNLSGTNYDVWAEEEESDSYFRTK